MIEIVNDELLIVTLSGVIDSEAVFALAKKLNVLEAERAYAKRLVFVEENLTVAITSDDVLFYKRQRREPQSTVKTAFCVFTDLQYGIARMFQALQESEKHKIEIFRNKEAAAEWLEVDSSLMQPQHA